MKKLAVLMVVIAGLATVLYFCHTPNLVKEWGEQSPGAKHWGELASVPAGTVEIVSIIGRHTREDILRSIFHSKASQHHLTSRDRMAGISEAAWILRDLNEHHPNKLLPGQDLQDPLGWKLRKWEFTEMSIIFWGTYRTDSEGKTLYPRLFLPEADGEWKLQWISQESISSEKDRVAILKSFFN